MRVAPPPWLVEPSGWLSEAARCEWRRRAPTWAAAGHLLPVDATLLGLYAETLAIYRAILEQTFSDPAVSGQPVALQMLDETVGDVAKMRRELRLPDDDDRPPIGP